MRVASISKRGKFPRTRARPGGARDKYTVWQKCAADAHNWGPTHKRVLAAEREPLCNES